MAPELLVKTLEATADDEVLVLLGNVSSLLM